MLNEMKMPVNTNAFKIISYDKIDKTIILEDLLGERATFTFFDSENPNIKIIYMAGHNGKTLINLNKNSVTNLDDVLAKAFIVGDYDLCEVLIQNGANRQMLAHAEKRLKPKKPTSDQQRILLRFLTTD